MAATRPAATEMPVAGAVRFYRPASSPMCAR